jgi:hypothetical protein
MKIKKVTRHFFVTDNNEKIYFKQPLDKVPTLEEFQKFIDTQETEVRRLLEIGKNNNS